MGLIWPVPGTGAVPPTAQVHPGIGAADATANIPVECDGTEMVAIARQPAPVAGLAPRPASAGPAPATPSTTIVSATRADPARLRFNTMRRSVANMRRRYTRTAGSCHVAVRCPVLCR